MKKILFTFCLIFSLVNFVYAEGKIDGKRDGNFNAVTINGGDFTVNGSAAGGCHTFKCWADTGDAAVFHNLGVGNDFTAAKINNVIYVNGTTNYPKTIAGIQSAIDALPITGGEIVISEGTFTNAGSDSIAIPSRVELNITIRGAGRGTILNCPTDGTDLVTFTGPTNNYFTGRGRGLILSDFRIEGNSASGDGISLTNLRDSKITNIWINSCGGYGLNGLFLSESTVEYVQCLLNVTGAMRYEESHHLTVSNSRCQFNTGPGITSTKPSGLFVDNCEFTYNDFANVYCVGDPSYAVGAATFFNHCNIGGQGTAENNYGVYILGESFVSITDCIIGWNRWANIRIEDSQNNTIAYNMLNQDSNYAMVLVNSSNNDISHNRIFKNYSGVAGGDVIQQDSNCFNNRIYANEPENDDIISVSDAVAIDACEIAWTGKTDVTTTRGNGSIDFLQGGYGSKNVIAAGFTTGLIATYDFTAIDLSAYTKVGFWVKSNTDLAANILRIVLDNSAACATPLETLNIPALTANDWKYVQLSFATPANLTAIISVGLNAASDPGAITVWIDDITTEYPKLWTDVSEKTFTVDKNLKVRLNDQLWGDMFSDQMTYELCGNSLSNFTALKLMLGWVTPATTESDLSGNVHSATYTNYLTTDQLAKGFVWSLNPDGTTKYAYVADHADFSFGNALTDSPFSVGGWFEILNGDTQELISKWNEATQQREWELQLDNTEQLQFLLCDESLNEYPYKYTGAISYGWHFIVCTYDGTGGATAADGEFVYIDGIVVSTTTTNRPNYIAMENTTSPVYVGCRMGAGSAIERVDIGDIGAGIFITGEVLTPATIWKMYVQQRGYFNL